MDVFFRFFFGDGNFGTGGCIVIRAKGSTTAKGLGPGRTDDPAAVVVVVLAGAVVVVALVGGFSDGWDSTAAGVDVGVGSPAAGAKR